MEESEGARRSITVARRFPASPAQAFDAWVLPQIACRWLFADPKTGSVCELDPRVGGSYRITREADGQRYVAVGEYREVSRPRRLAFTFGMPQFSSEFAAISVCIEPDGDGCVMRLVQGDLEAAHEDAIRHGWEEMFNLLETALLELSWPQPAAREQGREETPPPMRSFASSSIAAAGYDAAAQRLCVRYRGSGEAYAYEGVAPLVFEQLLAAPSKGRYVSRWIKDKYPFRRL